MIDLDSLPTPNELEGERLRRSLSDFCRAAWQLLVPSTPVVWHWAMGLMCEHLQAVSRGQIDRLIINVPPGMAKSTLVAVLWPVWEWASAPDVQWLFATYRSNLTFRDADRRRAVVRSEWYQARFGKKYQITGEGIEYLKNSARGFMYSTSTGGEVTGWRSDRLVLDDPQDPKGAESEIKRESTIEWLTRTWPSRMNLNSKHPGRVLIQQRLHEMDATGLYLKLGGWEHLKIPLEYTGKTFSTSLGKSDPRTKIGEVISEDIYPKKGREQLKRDLGPYGVSGQLQQEPAPAEGGIIKAAWIRHYDGDVPTMDTEIELPGFCRFKPREHFRFCTVDPATSDKELTRGGKLNDPDYFAIASWALVGSTRGAVLVLLDLILDRLDGPRQGPSVSAMHDVWKFSFIAVESVGFQLSLFQNLRQMGLPVRELSKAEDAIYRIDGDKTARAYAATPLMADGRFFVPTYAPWLGEFMKQVLYYPNVAHDDALDVATYAVALAMKIGPQLGQVLEEGEEDDRPVYHSDRGVNDPNKDFEPPTSDPWGAIRLAPP